MIATINERIKTIEKEMMRIYEKLNYSSDINRIIENDLHNSINDINKETCEYQEYNSICINK